MRLREFRLERPRQWGACWVACQLWRQLHLDAFWRERLPPSREGTTWDQMLLLLVAYRFLAPGSEWRLHREWLHHSAMGDLLGADLGGVAKDTLYRCLDKLLAHKADLCTFLSRRWQDLFEGDLRPARGYDLTSTYFESDPPDDAEDPRRYGCSDRPAGLRPGRAPSRKPTSTPSTWIEPSS